MSMITEYVRLQPHELARLRQLLTEDPDEAREYAGDLRMGDEAEEVSSRGMENDKAWPACSTYWQRSNTGRRDRRR